MAVDSWSRGLLPRRKGHHHALPLNVLAVRVGLTWGIGKSDFRAVPEGRKLVAGMEQHVIEYGVES